MLALENFLLLAFLRRETLPPLRTHALDARNPPFSCYLTLLLPSRARAIQTDRQHTQYVTDRPENTYRDPFSPICQCVPLQSQLSAACKSCRAESRRVASCRGRTASPFTFLLLCSACCRDTPASD
ncbi:hypothetical protein BDV95DRAFT_126433 [Massariosphaeria phaeospora]|uniref:Uncharacterized protein n=1 Tax=Massariosphaeria phaeospora TaxID=100035 RepID=A0A7C8M5X5_9PLEO|nr:hypothetical protein BDV95DRAFT_126433 [Massariosphaeria phaeospora]